MVKTKKKKANADFQKIKLKVGRKLKRDSTETKAEFKSRKIILKEIHGHIKDPITALTQHSEHISLHGKLTLLNHFNNALTPNIVKTLNKPIIDSLSKFVIDNSDQVRSATYKCLKTCYNHMKQQHLSLRDFAYTLKPYLDCAFTHFDGGISSDCTKFLEYLVNLNDAQIFEPLMHVLFRRIEVGNLTPREESLSRELKRLYLKHSKRQNIEFENKNDSVEPLRWTEDSVLLDLDCCIHESTNTRFESDNFQDRDVLLVPRARVENIVESFLRSVSDDDNVTRDEIQSVAQQRFLPTGGSN